MIHSIVTLRGIGLLHDALPSGAVELKGITVIYAENERGKSTFAAICRALADGNGELISARRTFSGTHDPQVHFRISDQSYKFENGAWNQDYPKIIVFDSHFVETNVCLGSRVEASHRENLLEFALGEHGVRLKKDIDEKTRRIDEINREMRDKARLISQHSDPYSVEEFVELQPEPDIDARLDEVQRRLADARSLESLQRRPVPEPLILPDLALDNLERVLSFSLENVMGEAERKVKEHIQRRLDAQGEEWLRQGAVYLETADECPFCGQSIHGVELVEAYKTYFDASYNELKRTIKDELDRVKETLGEACWGEISRVLTQNHAAQGSWSDRSDLHFPAELNKEEIKSVLDNLRDAAIEALTHKLSAPLSKIDLSDRLHRAAERYALIRARVEEYNQGVRKVKAEIDSLRRSLATVNLGELQEQIKRLEAEKRRSQPNIAKLCSEYQELREEKSRLEEEKRTKRRELEQYTENLLRRYRESINEFLDQFGAGFSIEELDVTHVRGTPRTEYQLIILGERISVSGQSEESMGRSFKTTMSEGGKRTLALAFFLARLKVDQNLRDYVVVVDDPVSSLDSGRRRATRNALAELAQHCSQLIVLSHDALFLRDLVRRFRDDEWEALQIRRYGDYSIIEKCDIHRLCRDEYYTIYETLIRYVEEGPTGNESEIARYIRDYLEHNLRNRFPIELEGAKNLGDMIRHIRQDPAAYGQVGQRLSDLDRLNDFSSPYHHLAADRPPPPTDAELKPMVQLALDIGRG
ncbi:MAG: hypothetical protein DRO93_07780 [Candidatus Thorarchaeota archaeon]|nr:MAG: hypothetical protein DRQ06_02455 [Candidatus Hydrothermae bacterium]RLI59942.1 MAG: hypothetical protein DRO93_07780 [Candidatus Thorarchaeota archaeon]